MIRFGNHTSEELEEEGYLTAGRPGVIMDIPSPNSKNLEKAIELANGEEFEYDGCVIYSKTNDERVNPNNKNHTGFFEQKKGIDRYLVVVQPLKKF